MNRREFLIIALGTAGAVAASALGIYEILKITQSTTTSKSTSTAETTRSASSSSASLAHDYPIGNRLVRIRVLNDDQSWTNEMQSYTTDTVLGWLNDLKPTTLNRYFSGPQDPTMVLPGSQNLTVQEFLQASINACQNPNNTTMIPRLSYTYYADDGRSAFLADAQDIFNLCDSLNPAQTMLSIDNYPPSSGSNPKILSLADSLFDIGWEGLCWGAGGATGPEGFATFAMVIPSSSNWQAPWSHMQQLQQIGGYGEFEVQIDFPGVMQTLVENNTNDQIAGIFTTMAQEQDNNSGVNGLGYNFPYHYMYPIYQWVSAESASDFHWDSTQVFTSSTGPYGGASLYQVMKALMLQYD